MLMAAAETQAATFAQLPPIAYPYGSVFRSNQSDGVQGGIRRSSADALCDSGHFPSWLRIALSGFVPMPTRPRFGCRIAEGLAVREALSSRSQRPDLAGSRPT